MSAVNLLSKIGKRKMKQEECEALMKQARTSDFCLQRIEDAMAVENYVRNMKQAHVSARAIHGQNIATTEARKGNQQPAKTKRVSDFMIHTILDMDENNNQIATPVQTLKSTLAPPRSFKTEPLYDLKHKDVIRYLRMKRERLYRDDTGKITECNVCGGCSFSKSKYFPLNFMEQHLHSHMSTPVYGCGLCRGRPVPYTSMSKPRVLNHLRTHLPQVVRCELNAFVIDNREALDEEMCELAKKCFGI